MNDILNAILLIIVPLIICGIITFVISYFDKNDLAMSPRYDGKQPLHILGTMNGIGFSFYGEFRFDIRTSSSARYLCFCILNIPIIPVGCYRVGQTRIQYVNFKKSIEKYKIYGSEKWRFLECVSIIILGITSVFVLVGIISLLEALF